VARSQPIRAGLLHCERGWLDVGSRIYLALYFRECRSGFLLGPVSTTQLFSFPVSCPGVDRQLIADDRLAAGAASELNASDLWRKLATFSHMPEGLRSRFGVGFDEAVNLCRSYAPRRADLDPC
jgi:hypothetical protein